MTFQLDAGETEMAGSSEPMQVSMIFTSTSYFTASSVCRVMAC